MPISLDLLMRSTAANSSLPRDDDADTSPSTTTLTISTHVNDTPPKPQTTSSTASSKPPNQYAKAKPKSKKRTRNTDFTIFVDPPPATYPHRPAPKKPKNGIRILLGPRSPNITTAAPPTRSPDTPFRFSGSDPFWSDTENHDPQPSTPRPAPAPRASSARGSAQPPRPLRPRRSVPLSAPRSMALYTLLGIVDWTVSTEEIAAAWRRAALENHPDRVDEEEKDVATRNMQRLNAAKEVLCDGERRRRYDVDGEVPWSEVE